MPMPTIPKALYPLVPNAPGVPALIRNAVKIADAATLGQFGLSNALDNLIGADPVQWGVFSAGGQAVAVSDSVVSFDYRNGSRLSDYPVERGAFASYNKVANPFDVKVRMSCGGSEEQRAAFVKALDSAASSLDLYTVWTPEKRYESVNIESVDYRRESSAGAHFIAADLYLREIRQTAAAAFSAPKTAAAADVKSQGQVQAAPVTPAQSTAITSAAKKLKGATNTGGATGSWGISTGGATGSW